jgi:site-specific DNA recombinase
MPTQADLYLRLSDFRADDRDSFPAREAALRAEASRLGWGVHRVVIENDVDQDGRRKPASAFKRREVTLPGSRTELRVYRPGFRSVLDDLMAGRANAVLAEDLDRAFRDPRDLEDFIDVCEATRANAWSLSESLTMTNGGTDAEITTARIMVTMANKASRDAARQMEDSRTRRARAGLWGGSGHRPFGYMLNGGGTLAIIEAEAKVIRQAAAGVLSESFRPFYGKDYDGKGRPPGAESLTTLAAGLRDAGITTPGGKQWSAKMLREALLKPSIAGLAVVHERDRDKGTDQVTVVKAGWKAILDRETWEAVRAKLTDPARLTHTGNVARHLGTGIYECGQCGSTVKVNGGGGKRAPAYVCKGCRSMRRLVSGADDYTVAHVIARLERPDLADLLRPAPAAGVDVAALRKRRTVLVARGKAAARLFAVGDISEAEYAEAARVRKTELDKIAADLAVPAEADPLAEFRDAPDAGEVWRGLSLARKRAVLSLLVRVRLLPSPPTGPGKFRPETVEVIERV